MRKPKQEKEKDKMTLDQIVTVLIDMAAIHKNPYKEYISDEGFNKYRANQKKAVENLAPLIRLLCDSGIIHGVLRKNDAYVSFSFDECYINGGFALEADESKAFSHSENYAGFKFKKEKNKNKKRKRTK